MKHAVVAILILFLAACGGRGRSGSIESIGTPSGETSSIVSNIPTTYAAETDTPVAMTETPPPPTVTPIPSATPRINEPLKPGKGVRLTSIQMFDLQNGWGFDSEYHILRTQDGGRTWEDVTPPTGYYARKGFFAVDADTAWATHTVGLYIKPVRSHVWRTDDGGQTWNPSEEFRLDVDHNGQPYPSEFYLPQGMQFIDRQTGWLLAAVAYNMNSASPLFFHTTDGGETWRTINSRIQFPSSCLGVGFVFTDSKTGWAGGNCFTQGVIFTPMQSIFGEGGWSVARTTDGGRAYEQRTMMPIPADLQQPEILAAEGNCGEIRLLPIANNVISIEWGCSVFTALRPDYRNFALSADGGQTWRSWKSSGNESFLDASHGWRLLSAGELQQTSDGGLNWTTIKVVTWENAQFNFVSEQEGWAIASIGHGSAFLHTVNGGQTWMQLNPRIGP